jgi:hypothetical protein
VAVAVAVLFVSAGSASGAVRGDALSIGIALGGGVVRQAGVIEYHATVTSGEAVAGPVALHVALDPARERILAWTSSSTTVACTLRPVTMDCRLPPLAAGDSVYITFQARVDASATGTISTHATVSGGGSSSSADVSATIDTRYPRPADLSLVLRSSSGGVHGATWTWRVGNRGPGTAPASAFAESSALGAAIRVVASTTKGACTVSGRAGIDAATIACKLGVIPAGGSITITIHAPTYTESGISLVEHASVISSSLDPDPTNNGNKPVKVPLRSAAP